MQAQRGAGSEECDGRVTPLAATRPAARLGRLGRLGTLAMLAAERHHGISLARGDLG